MREIWFEYEVLERSRGLVLFRITKVLWNGLAFDKWKAWLHGYNRGFEITFPDRYKNVNLNKLTPDVLLVCTSEPDVWLHDLLKRHKLMIELEGMELRVENGQASVHNLFV